MKIKIFENAEKKLKNTAFSVASGFLMIRHSAFNLAADKTFRFSLPLFHSKIIGFLTYNIELLADFPSLLLGLKKHKCFSLYSSVKLGFISMIHMTLFLYSACGRTVEPREFSI